MAGLALLGLGGALAGCGARGPIRVGFIGGMSGRVADLGIGGRNGAQLAVDDVNAQGGLDGRPIELVVRDDEQDNDKARARFIELVEAGVAFVVGPMTSSIAVALAPVAAERGVALVSPTVTTHELSGKLDAFIRIVPDAPSGAAQQADLLFGRGLRRVVTVADLNNRAFSQSWAGGVAVRMKERGGEALTPVEYKSAPNISYADIARQAAVAGADVIVIAASASDSALLCQQLRKLDAKVVLATSPWAGTEQLIQMGGRALEGTIVAQYFDRASKEAAYVRFAELHARRFGEPPGFPATTGYDALRVGLQALALGGSGPALRSLQQARSYAGLQRPIVIDANGDTRSPMFMTEVRDGAYAALAS